MMPYFVTSTGSDRKQEETSATSVLPFVFGSVFDILCHKWCYSRRYIHSLHLRTDRQIRAIRNVGECLIFRRCDAYLLFRISVLPDMLSLPTVLLRCNQPLCFSSGSCGIIAELLMMHRPARNSTL